MIRYINKSVQSIRRIIIVVTSVITFLIFSVAAYAQEPPPRPIVVTVTGQALSFGAFYHGAVGGTITINSDGSRTSSGDVVPLGLGYVYSTALYEIVANPGTVISLLNGPDVNLVGSNGGTLSLHIGDSDLGSSFVTTAPYPVPTELNVGGTLSVGNSIANPPGSYSGTFDITFIQE